MAKFAAGVVDTGGKFAAGIATSVVDIGGAPRLVNISVNFRKKFKMTLLLFSGARGKVIHEKKPEAKNLVTLSL